MSFSSMCFKDYFVMCSFIFLAACSGGLKATTASVATIPTSTTAPSSTSVQSNSISPGPQAGDLNILAYGAVGDGQTDNTTAIQNALNAAAAEGVGVYVPPGTFNFGNLLNVNGIRLNGASYATSILQSTGSNQTIQMGGTGAIIANLQFITTFTAGRQNDSLINSAIAAISATNCQVDHVLINGNFTGGIFSFGSSGCKFTNNTIENTYADCIGNYYGSTNNLVDSNYIFNCGDDGISVVSYANESLNSGHTITNNVVQGNSWGRNFTVVGGKNITFTNNLADGNTANLACLYFAAENNGSASTLGVSNVTWNNGTIEQCGVSSTGYAALTMFNGYSSGNALSNLTFENSVIKVSGAEEGIFISGANISGVSLLNYTESTSQSPNNIAVSGVVNSAVSSGVTGYAPSAVGVDARLVTP